MSVSSVAPPRAATPADSRPTRPSRPPARRTWNVRRVFAVALLRGRRRWWLGVGALGLLLHEVAEALVPILVGAVIDRAVVAQDPWALAALLGALAVVFVVLSMSWRFGALAITRLAAHGEHDLRLDGVARVLAPAGMARRRPAGEVDAILGADAERVAGTAWSVGHLIAAVAALVVTAVAMLRASLPIGIAVLAVTPLLLAVLHRISRPVQTRSQHEQAAAAHAATLATDSLAGLRVLAGLGARTAAADRYTVASQSALGAAVAAARARVTFTSVGSVLTGLVLAGVAIACAWSAWAGTMSIGQMVAVIGLAQYVQRPMSTVGWVLVDLAMRRGSAVRVADLLDTPPLLDAADDGASLDHNASLDHSAGVNHDATSPDAAAPARWALTIDPTDATAATDNPAYPTTAAAGSPGDVANPAPLPRLRVAPGEVVGVAGDAARTQALVDALGGRTPTPPGVRVHGRDLRALGPDGLRVHVFAPPREPMLFTTTVERNLLAGAEPPVDADVLRATAADEVLEHLTDGLGTVLLGAGSQMSGGQRQRLALARAWAAPQPLLVLHEPTTAIDAVTEARIAGALGVRTARTLLLVTCSAELLAACDRVVVVGAAADDDAEGSHDDLLATHPTYREVVS